MLQLRWVTKTRKVTRENNPGYYGGGVHEVSEQYRVLQYREVVEDIATDWIDVPDAGLIET